MTMMIMMIIITFCALDILILEFLPCKWQLVWNMLIKIISVKKKKNNNNNNNNNNKSIYLYTIIKNTALLMWSCTI